jgi:hypothetical protein
MNKRARWIAWPYNILYEYLDLYNNKFEATVATLEVFLIAFGLWTTFHSLGEAGLAKIEMAFESAEFVVFLLLLLTALSRFLVSIRRTKLGYAYESILKKFDLGNAPEALLHFQEQIETSPMGYAPGLLSSWTDDVQLWADKIAGQTASLLSLRSWFSIDRQWQRRERDSLFEWFTEFPAALWVVPAAASPQKGPLSGGYLSIVVPMTRHSSRSIRKGQRATDLAELDLSIRELFGNNERRSASEVQRLDLLAYLHIYLPSPEAPQTRDDTRLLAASIQHLAFLLQAIYGVSGGDFVKSWDFSVLCESSNPRMNMILEQLGFVRIEREPDGSETQRREARSYAGFTLFELNVIHGRSDVPEGRYLLAMLSRLVLRFRENETQNPVA